MESYLKWLNYLKRKLTIFRKLLFLESCYKRKVTKNGKPTKTSNLTLTMLLIMRQSWIRVDSLKKEWLPILTLWYNFVGGLRYIYSDLLVRFLMTHDLFLLPPLWLLTIVYLKSVVHRLRKSDVKTFENWVILNIIIDN